MPFVEIAPGDRDLLGRAGLANPDDFLDLPGVILSGHPDRHVLRAEVGGVRFILKKEHRVPWRDRFTSAWDGFGWSSKSVREARVLAALRDAGIGCPDVVAVGEVGARAFLLLREVEDALELREVLANMPAAADLRALAACLGGELARVHALGFAQPDLFAKHVLVSRDAVGFRICLLDWQRSRRHRRLSWRRRVGDLAALDASLGEGLASNRLRLRVLRTYLLAGRAARPPLRRVAAAVRAAAVLLLKRRKIRELRQHVRAGQSLLWPFGDERVCVTPEFFASVGNRLPACLDPDPAARGEPTVEQCDVPLPCNRSGRLVRRWSGRPARRVKFAAPEFAEASLLLRLERFGIEGPRLLAMGYRDLTPAQRYSFLLVEPPAKATTIAAGSRQLRRAGWLLHQLHEAGCRPVSVETFVHSLAPSPAGGVALTDVAHLARTTADPAALAREDLPALAAHVRGRVTRTDALRFLLGYLGKRRIDDEARQFVAMLNVWERQAAR